LTVPVPPLQLTMGGVLVGGGVSVVVVESGDLGAAGQGQGLVVRERVISWRQRCTRRGQVAGAGCRRDKCAAGAELCHKLFQPFVLHEMSLGAYSILVLRRLFIVT
jgi:hypothetical protein